MINILKKNLTTLAIITLVAFCTARNAFAGQPYKGYPAGFNGKGTIDHISTESISIGDIKFIITPDTTFNIPDSLNCSPMWIKKNHFIYYILESRADKPKKTIRSLWVVKNKNDHIERP